MAINEACRACLSNQSRPLEEGEHCDGILETKSVSNGTETFVVQVCPRETMLGRLASFYEARGPISGVIVAHEGTIPSEEDYVQLADSRSI